MKTQTAPSIRPAAKITTEALAAKFGAQPQSARASVCRFGHWQGLVPTKMPNGRLMWDLAEADRLLAGEAIKTPDVECLAAHAARKATSKIPEHIARKAAAKAKRLAAAAVATGEAAK